MQTILLKFSALTGLPCYPISLQIARIHTINAVESAHLMRGNPTSFRVWLNERALSIQVGRSKSRTRQLSFVQQATEIHIRRSRHVAAVRELSDRRSGRRHG